MGNTTCAEEILPAEKYWGTTQDCCRGVQNHPQFELKTSFLYPKLTTEQDQAMWLVFKIAGLAVLTASEAYETQRRCRNIAAMIFDNRLPIHTFSSKSLFLFASYIDAFRKPGFIWSKCLESEAEFVISKPPALEIDTKEFMQSFRILFHNSLKLNCYGALTLSLFLLFFHRVMLTPQGITVNWIWLVQSIIGQIYPFNNNCGR